METASYADDDICAREFADVLSMWIFQTPCLITQPITRKTSIPQTNFETTHVHTHTGTQAHRNGIHVIPRAYRFHITFIAFVASSMRLWWHFFHMHLLHHSWNNMWCSLANVVSPKNARTIKETATRKAKCVMINFQI